MNTRSGIVKQHDHLPVVCRARKTDDSLAREEIDQTFKRGLRAIEAVEWFFMEEDA